jgi:hypothetical protein
MSIGLDSVMLKMKRFGFPFAALILFIATADGAAALLHAKPWDPLGWGLAALFAAVVDTVLISSLLEWQKTRGLAALLTVAIFMGASGLASMNFWYRHIRGSRKPPKCSKCSAIRFLAS